jgi:hypothetical protein
MPNAAHECNNRRTLEPAVGPNNLPTLGKSVKKTGNRAGDAGQVPIADAARQACGAIEIPTSAAT